MRNRCIHCILCTAGLSVTLADRLRLMAPGSPGPAEWVHAELEGSGELSRTLGQLNHAAVLSGMRSQYEGAGSMRSGRHPRPTRGCRRRRAGHAFGAFRGCNTPVPRH